jgi:hypothetical protein
MNEVGGSQEWRGHGFNSHACVAGSAQRWGPGWPGAARCGLRPSLHTRAEAARFHDEHIAVEPDVIAGLREKLRADVKAVLVTGDTSTLVKHMRNDPRLRIASNPVDAEQLLAVLKELLSA